MKNKTKKNDKKQVAKICKTANKTSKQRVNILKQGTHINWRWCIKVLILTFALSIMFSVLSELALTTASTFIALLVIIFLMLVGIIFDCIGVATTSCDVETFESMINSNIKGAKEAMYFVKNAEKVSVICCDIIGDVCGILCGAAGAAIVTKIIGVNVDASLSILVSALVSGVIAGLTIFGKSIEKGVAVNKSEQILLLVGRAVKILFK